MAAIVDDDVRLPGGPRLALRRAAGNLRPFMLVHGLASNARLWDGVSRELAAAGHEVVAVDLRGHGRSEQAAHGYSTQQVADDLAELSRILGLTGSRMPVAAGQSWGGNVVVTLAAVHGGVAAVALVDGGWIALGERYATFDQCWQQLAPPEFDGVRREVLVARIRRGHPTWSAEAVEATLANLEELPDGTVRPWLTREHHREILHSMWVTDVRELYARVRVPVLLAPAVPSSPDEVRRAAPIAAAQRLADAEILWFESADHDLHAQHPDRLATALLALAARAERAAS